MEMGSPMSFKLPVEVINNYKEGLTERSSFKKSLTEEIKKLCDFIHNINSESTSIINQIAKLENEDNINKKYVVTEVDPESSSILREFRNKYDITQSGLLWLWLKENGQLFKNLDDNIENNPLSRDAENSNKTDEVYIKTKNKLNLLNKNDVDIKNKMDISLQKIEKAKKDNKNDSYQDVETNIYGTSNANFSKMNSLMDINDYEGATEKLIIKLPHSTIENFKANLSDFKLNRNDKNFDDDLLLKIIQDEIRKLCKVIDKAKSITTIINHTKRIEKYKIDKKELVLELDPNSVDLLNKLNKIYNITPSGIIWLWLSSGQLKYNLFNLVD